MSAITIAEATVNSKSPRQQKAADGKTVFAFRLREMLIQEQVEDREKNIPDQGCRNHCRFVSVDIRERRYYVSFIYITNGVVSHIPKFGDLHREIFKFWDM